MTFTAYIEDPTYIGKFPVFPRTNRTNVFKSVRAASRRLDHAASRFSHDTRGYIYNMDGDLVLTIAL